MSWDATTGKVAIGKGLNPNAEELASTIIPEAWYSDVQYMHVGSNNRKGEWKLHRQCECKPTDRDRSNANGSLCSLQRINLTSPAVTPTPPAVNVSIV